MKYFVMFRYTKADGVNTFFRPMVEIGLDDVAVYTCYEQAHKEASSRTRRRHNIVGYVVHTL